MLPAWANWSADCASSFTRTFGAKNYFGGNAAQTGPSVLPCQDTLATC